MARLARLTSRDLGKAEQLADEAERLLSAVGDKKQIGFIFVERGFIRLAAASSAEEFLDRASDIASERSAGPESELDEKLAMLRRAQSAFDAGKPLIRGQCREDLTEGQLRWLEHHLGGTDGIPDG